MLIDWFTVGAQTLNFLILVWLMKRFLYQPVLRAIDEREKRIASELADAAAKQAEAERQRAEFQRKNQVFDQQRARLLSQATDEAIVERRRLIEDARNAADSLAAQRHEALRNEIRSLSQSVAGRTRQEVFAIARKVLRDLANASLEERMGEVFTRRLRELDDPTRRKLATSLDTTADPALVRSTFELPAEQRAAIQHALNETFSAEIHVRFETSPDLVSGIELMTNGQKLAWSISDYLASLQRSVDELLNDPVRSERSTDIESGTQPAARES